MTLRTCQTQHYRTSRFVVCWASGLCCRFNAGARSRSIIGSRGKYPFYFPSSLSLWRFYRFQCFVPVFAKFWPPLSPNKRWNVRRCFLMRRRQTPFANGPDDSAEQILARIGESRLTLSGGNWDFVSPAAKDLVQRMLHIDPHQRVSLQQVLTHRWITGRDQLPERRLVLPDTSHTVKVSTFSWIFSCRGGLFLSMSDCSARGLRIKFMLLTVSGVFLKSLPYAASGMRCKLSAFPKPTQLLFSKGW